MVARPRALHDVTTVETLFEHGRPNSARLYDALLGGKDNYAADRAALEFISSAAPHVRPAALANRCFMEWVVRRLVADGVTPFIDIGAGYPAGRNVHEIAQRARPGCRGHRAAHRTGAERGGQAAREVARPSGIGSGAEARQGSTSAPTSPDTSWPSASASESRSSMAASAITVPGG